MARTRLGQLQQGTPAQQPGWAGQPQAGPVPGSGGWQSGGSVLRDTLRGGDVGDDLAGLAMGAAGRFIGRAISQRVQRAVTERVVPAVTASGESLLREQIAIAEKYPGLSACMADKVIFLAGGSRVVPMSEVNLGAITMAQADQLVARLQG